MDWKKSKKCKTRQIKIKKLQNNTKGTNVEGWLKCKLKKCKWLNVKNTWK